MRIIGHKLNAKSLINDNMGVCLFATGIILFPKFVFLGSCFFIWLLNRAELLGDIFSFFCFLAEFFLLFLLNAILVPLGELMLFDLSKQEKNVDDIEATREYRFDFVQEESVNYIQEAVSGQSGFTKSIEVLRSFGISRLVRLRLRVLVNLFRDIAFTSIPAILLVAVLFIYSFYTPMPTGAFISFVVGALVIVLLVVMEFALEYDKYRFVYIFIPEFLFEFENYTQPYTAMLVKSRDTVSENVNDIRKCEVSFWGWELLSILLLPIFIPLIYLVPYKKLTIYNVIE